MPSDAIRQATARFLKEEILTTLVLGGGKNSRVFKVETASHTVVLKHYFRSENDSRDRQGTEFRALSYLASQGIQRLPTPLCVDEQLGFTLFSNLEGEVITDDLLTSSDEQDFIEFVRLLVAASHQPEAAALNPASEAFFSLKEVVGNIEARLWRLGNRSGSAPMAGELKDFLDTRFEPALARLSSQAISYYEEIGLTEVSVLDVSSRVLSPSDFGLHNSLKTPDGLAFLDFEYFGWDDPVKLISDYALHPAQGDPGEKRFEVARQMFALFKEQVGFTNRFQALFPLFALKWCMIILNEFLAEENARREFSGETRDIEAVLARQLGLAQAMLGRALSGKELAALVK